MAPVALASAPGAVSSCAPAKRRYVSPFRGLTLQKVLPTVFGSKQAILKQTCNSMDTGIKSSHGDLKAIFCALIALTLAFHVGSALRGHGLFRDQHLGTALHYAQTKISLADTIIVGFNVRPEPKVRDLAKKSNIEIKLYTIIYDLIEDIKQALRGMLEPVYQEVIQGRAEVRDIFKVPKIGIIAGCMVTEGTLVRGAQARLLRDSVVIHEGRVESLRRFKDDAKEVATGFECGISLGNYNDIKVGDIVEAFTQEKVENTATW